MAPSSGSLSLPPSGWEVPRWTPYGDWRSLFSFGRAAWFDWVARLPEGRSRLNGGNMTIYEIFFVVIILVVSAWALRHTQADPKDPRW